ncbi:MAG: DUF5357 family protein [Cyanobacteria bacterium SID2]|nr:DUF5357 family protein [Cyanobacteria bacterium SID2]MBP0002305.1 DUF5357 family protein [Cyanobacteria bacterium SBC]
MENWKWLRSQLQPPKLMSWQTLMLACMGTWLLSFLVVLSDPNAQFSNSNWTRLGWVLFILSVTWWQTVDPWKIWKVSIGPGIIAAVLCSIFFRNDFNNLPRVAFLVWPLLTSTIAAIPSFVGKSKNWRVPPVDERPKLLLQTLLALVVTCWISLTFLLQDWIVQYPGILSADLTQSDFVVRLGTPIELRGYRIERTIKAVLESQMRNKTWSEIERFLLEVKKNPKWLEDTVTGSSENREDRSLQVTLDIYGDTDDEYQLSVTFFWWNRWFQDMQGSMVLTCRVRREDTSPAFSANYRDTGGSMECNTDNQVIFSTQTEDIQEDSNESP